MIPTCATLPTACLHRPLLYSIGTLYGILRIPGDIRSTIIFVLLARDLERIEPTHRVFSEVLLVLEILLGVLRTCAHAKRVEQAGPWLAVSTSSQQREQGSILARPHKKQTRLLPIPACLPGPNCSAASPSRCTEYSVDRSMLLLTRRPPIHLK